MAKSKIPNGLERRHLVEKGLNEPQALRIAEAYLAEGRVVDAIDFLQKAGAVDRLGELRAEAVTNGDAFLLRATTRALDDAPTDSEWRALADAAEAAGKALYATDARRQIGDDTEV